MLAKEFKLTEKRDFQRVKDLGTTIHSKNYLFTFFKRREKQTESPRFGFIITTKNAPRAVDRNRAKRVLNEAVRQQLTSVIDGVDCVFLISNTILRAYTADVMKEVKETFENAKITKSS